MGRTRRSHLPGGIFHLTARTQGREPWFTPVLRTRILHYLARAVAGSDARLLAYAVMPNHLHLVVRQGRRPLWCLMQPLLRGTALLVQRSHGVSGHIFEKRFADRPCFDPEYARNAVVYTHLNPVRARLVDDALAYRWCSHGVYCGTAPAPAHLAADDALRLFAPAEDSGLDEARRTYALFVEWRYACDRAEDAGLAPPRVWGGDLSWSQRFAPLFRGATLDPFLDEARRAADLAEIARRTLIERAPDLSLERVRGGEKSRQVVDVRRAMIRRMAATGHAGGAIARYMGVSDQCVSNVLRAGS